MDFTGYGIMFIAVVILTWLYFMAKRKEPANEDPVEQCAKNIQLLMRRVEKLEKEKPSFTLNQEIKDSIKLVREEQENMRNLLSESLMNFNTTVLRLIATFKPKKKELDQ